MPLLNHRQTLTRHKGCVYRKEHDEHSWDGWWKSLVKDINVFAEPVEDATDGCYVKERGRRTQNILKQHDVQPSRGVNTAQVEGYRADETCDHYKTNTLQTILYKVMKSTCSSANLFLIAVF